MREKLRRSVIELVGRHSTNDTDLIDHFCQIGQQFADDLAALAVSSEFELSRQNLGDAADEGKPFPF